jgi:hypothetical protein
MKGLGVLAMWAALNAAASAAAQPITWSASIDVAVGRGERGPWRQNDSRYDYVDDPAVAIDGEGRVAVAWVDQARKDVLLQRFSARGSALGPPVNVSRSPAVFSWLPRVAVAPQDPQRIFVLWQEIVFSGGTHGGDILFARSEDGGATFSAPLNLSRSAAGDGKGRIDRQRWDNGSLDLAAGREGALYAAWTEYEGALWLARSVDGGRSFAPPLRVAGGDAEPARAPSLALGAASTVYLAWTRGDDPAADIRIAPSEEGGARFAEPRIVERTEGYSDAPRIAVDARGVLHLVWSESARGRAGARHVRYTRSSDGARSFEPSRDVSGPDAGFPALGIDARGTLYALWERFPGSSVRALGLALALSRDGGRSFTPPRDVPASADPAGASNGSVQGRLMAKLAVSRAGEVAIVNSSLADGARSRVWLMRGN